MKPRYLTKSRFKLALECPTKLYYDGKSEYANQNIEDTFLLALAEGGFQVGELAKLYFPGGHEIMTHDYEEALQQTNELLKQDSVIIYEGAIRFKNLFIRADILIKNKKQLELIEVKSKSVDMPSEEVFLNNSGSIASTWQPYLYDIAFQKFVLQRSFPDYSITASLILADKNALSPTDGLNQKFKIIKDNEGRKRVFVSPKLSYKDLDKPILVRINADKCCEIIYSENFCDEANPLSFAKYISLLADYYKRDEKIAAYPSVVCGSCEFKTFEEVVLAGLKSGFHECWKEYFGWSDDDFREPTVFDIWNFRKKSLFINAGRIKVSEIDVEDISPRKDNKPGISASERQWLQVSKAKNNDTKYWIDAENLQQKMNTWIYPLHFIDFETTMVAIPFNKGRHPYEGIAFQYSHHIVHKDGQDRAWWTVSEYNTGRFPEL